MLDYQLVAFSAPLRAAAAFLLASAADGAAADITAAVIQVRQNGTRQPCLLWHGPVVTAICQLAAQAGTSS